MSKFKVTVQYLDGHVAVHETGRLVTETAQWKLQQQAGSDDRITLIPMAAVRHIRMERTGEGGAAVPSVVGGGGGGGGGFTWTAPTAVTTWAAHTNAATWTTP